MAKLKIKVNGQWVEILTSFTETDPVFQAWLNSNPLSGFLTSELDPVFTAWLNSNPLAGFLTSELDPVFTAWLNSNPLAGFLTSETDPIFQAWLLTNPLANLHAPGSDNQVGDGVTITGTGTILDPFISTPITTSILNKNIGSFTLSLTDANNYLCINYATSVNVTIPKNSVVAFPIGTIITLEQSGAGTVTVIPIDTDVTINAFDGKSTYGQYAGMQIIKVNTNIWTCIAGVDW